MTTRTILDRWYVRLLIGLTVAIVYYTFARLGLELAYVSPYATAIWPPTGIAIAALLLLGPRVWPSISLGAFVVNATTGGAPLIGLGVALGNTLEGITAAQLTSRFANGRRAFEHPRGVSSFVLLAALLSTTISASVGVVTLALNGAAAWSELGPIWLTWWLGDATGALLVTPLLVTWSTPVTLLRQPRRWLEGAALFLSLALTAAVVFSGAFGWSRQHYSLEFIVVPVLIWGALRFGPRGAATLSALLSVGAIWGTLHGFGPFVLATPNSSLLLMQAYLGVVAVVTLVLAAATFDRERAEERIRATEERLRLAEAAARQQEAQRANDAEEARDRLREFLGMVVHDLRGPLTVAMGYTQLIQRQFSTGDTRGGERTLARIDSALETMRRLVDDLLDSVRIGGGRFVVHQRPTDLVDLATRAVEEQQATGAPHLFVVEGPEHEPGEWDTDRLEQVLRNLLSNASKYSPAGTTVRVRIESTADRVLIAVEDQGIGIDPADLDQLFQPFARLGQAGQTTGTGLGLYITKGIVEAHHGRIWVESLVGRGSTFFVELPRHRPEVRAAGPEL